MAQNNSVVHHETYCLGKILEMATIWMNQHYTPILISWRSKRNKQEYYGTNKVVEKFQALYENSLDWQHTFNADRVIILIFNGG